MSIAERHVQTQHAFYSAEEETLEFALRLFGVSEEDIRGGNNWPFEDVSVDGSDWDGTSLELKGCRDGLEASEEIAEAAWGEGFDVVDLEYADRTYRRWFPTATKRRHEEIRQKYHKED